MIMIHSATSYRDKVGREREDEKWQHYYTDAGLLELPIPRKKLATPLSVAVAAGNQDIVEMLRAQGAVSDPQNASTPLVLRWCA